VPADYTEVAKGLKKLLADNQPRVRVFTLGGATEASIWSCYYEVGVVAQSWRSIPYGKPLANQALFVLDKHLQIAPSLVPGEICIGGVGLAECYWADKEKTDKAFVYGEPRGERERLYKTGDVGRYMADGHVEILGRMDFQLKLHGYRIEIGEVEAALNSCERVGNSVALPWPPPPEKSMQLIGFVQLESGGSEGAPEDGPEETFKALEQQALRTAAAALPTYMVPSKLHVLRQVQLSANGKVDRKWLQEIHRNYLQDSPDDASGGSHAEEPRTETETRLAALLRKLLDAPSLQPNIFTDFVHLGVDSAALLKLKPLVDKVSSRPCVCWGGGSGPALTRRVYCVRGSCGGSGRALLTCRVSYVRGSRRSLSSRCSSPPSLNTAPSRSLPAGSTRSVA
jgi:hypothetical protein